MALNLSIVKSPAGVTLASSQKIFSEQGGTIGRGDGNDWVLSDPDRFLSSRHCCFGFEDGQYYLTDTSTNGTFINGAPEPIGKGGKIPVNDGDSIELGDYQFRIGLEPDIAMPNDPFAAPEPAPEPAAAPADIFSNGDPFAALESSSSPASDPFGSQGFETSPGISLNPDSVSVDPLAALDQAGGPEFQEPAGNIQNQGFGDDFGAATPSNDIFSTPGEGGGGDIFDSPSMGDGAGVIGQAVDWPESNNENLIPDDWDDDLLGGNSLEPAVPTPAPAPIPLPRASRGQDLGGAHRSMPLTDPPKRPLVTDSPLLEERQSEHVDAFASTPAQEPARGNATPRPRRPPEPAPQTPPQPPRDDVSGAVGKALLEGLGLGDRELSRAETDNIYVVLGELMPVIINGMMQVLRSRASIKNEFRMNVTTIQPIENNPLKFSANAQEAIDNMFLRNSDAYMGPKQAFQEGFDGVGEHQVAIIAGIRAAFKSMMDRFDPEQLERQFDKQNKGVVLPGMQRNKYWKSYNEYYTGFVDNMENSFQYLFGDEFVQAYEDQLRRLAFERKQKQKTD